MHLSNYVQNLIVDHLWRTATWAKSTVRYFALLRIADSEGNMAELTGGNYGRARLDAADANYTATQGGVSGASSGTSGSTSNVSTINFPQPSADWQLAVAFAVYDAQNGGNLLGWEMLDEPMQIKAGESDVMFEAGGFVFTVD